MKPLEVAHGKMIWHSKGLGTVTREMVVQRAREIAIINGHVPNHYTRDDFFEAKRELVGDDAPEFDDNEFEAVNALTTWDEDPGTSGHEVDRTEPSDEQVVDDELIHEGLDEAEHDTMVEGAKANAGGGE
jgi:hypothetical protein